MRVVLFHYHIFKNSGTTFDHAIKRKLGRRFVEHDARPGEKSILQSEVGTLIHNYSDVLAFSSHTARLPAPRIEGIKVEPVVFVRHPILRLKSIYSWLKKTNLKVKLKSLAKISDMPDRDFARKQSLTSRSFEHWIAQLIDSERGRNHISNAQTQLLSGHYEIRPKRVSVESHGERLFDLNQAKKNLSEVKLLGRTENFDEDMNRFIPYLLDMGIPLDNKKLKPRNVTDKNFNLPLDSRILNIQNQLGPELSDSLDKLISQDLELFRWVENTLASKRCL